MAVHARGSRKQSLKRSSPVLDLAASRNPSSSRGSRVERDDHAPPRRRAGLGLGILGRLSPNAPRSPPAPRPARSGSAIEQLPRIGRDQRKESRRQGVPREFVRVLTGYPDFAAGVHWFGATGQWTRRSTDSRR